METPERPPGWSPALWAAAMVTSLSWSFLCNLVLELMQTGGNWDRLVTYTLHDRAVLFALGSLLVWCVFLLVWAVTSLLRVALAVLTALTLVVGYANYKKITVRMEPLYPSDLFFAGEATFLGQMVGLKTVAALTTLVGLAVFTILLAARILARRYPRRGGGRTHRESSLRLLSRTIVAVLSLSTLVYAAQFNQTGNQVRAAYEAGGAEWKFWFQRLNYYSNGFVGGMLYNTQVPAMEAPPGYGRRTMQEISDRYRDRANERNASRPRDVLSNANIIMVLSEAFSDPTEVEGVTYAEDPIPYARELMRDVPSGHMLAQLYGGGTANMEFEALTGLSLSQFMPQMNSPYQMLLPELESFPSAVGNGMTFGRRAIAVHPYMTSMYKREQSYPVLGFEDFIGLEDMAEPSKLEHSEFVSDAAAFSEVEKQISSLDDPVLVNLVTMQNHYPMSDHYERPIPVTGLKGDYEKEASGYGRGLRYTDDALRGFLDRLRSLDEPTAVIFYGDHQPGIWPQSIQRMNGNLAMRTTPFFLWANFELVRDPVTAEYTSPIYFLPLLHQATDAPIPPFYALLLELYEEVPAMAQGLMLDQHGDRVRPSDLPPKAREVLRHYRLVQYDLSIGSRFSEDEMFPQARRSTMASN